MTREEKKKHIENLKKLYAKTNNIWHGFNFAHGGNPNCRLFDRVAEIQELALGFVRDLIGDEHNYLSWYIYDNEWGERRLTVQIDDGPERVIINYDDILNVIEEL